MVAVALGRDGTVSVFGEKVYVSNSQGPVISMCAGAIMTPCFFAVKRVALASSILPAGPGLQAPGA